MGQNESSSATSNTSKGAKSSIFGAIIGTVAIVPN